MTEITRVQPKGIGQTFPSSHWTAIIKEGSSAVAGCNQNLRDECSLKKWARERRHPDTEFSLSRVEASGASSAGQDPVRKMGLVGNC